MTLTQLIKYADISISDMAKLIGVSIAKMQARADGHKRALTLSQQEQLRALLIDEEEDENDGLDWVKLADDYEPPAPTGAQYWGYGSFYKIASNRVWIYVDCEWIKSNKTQQAVKGYARVKEK